MKHECKEYEEYEEHPHTHIHNTFNKNVWHLNETQLTQRQTHVTTYKQAYIPTYI